MLMKVKKLKDEKASRGENKITDLFLAIAGYKAVKKLSIIAYPRKLEELTYEEIVRIIKKKIQPKLSQRESNSRRLDSTQMSL